MDVEKTRETVRPPVRLSKSKVYLLILLGSGPPPPASSPAVKRLPRGSRFVVEFVFPLLPFPFPLLFPFVGIAERPIPVETLLKPDPPGLLRRLIPDEPGFRGRTVNYSLLLWVL